HASGSDPRTFSQFVQSSAFYCAIPGTMIARNTGKGPGQFNITMNFQKTVRLKSPASTPPANRAGNAGGPNGVNNFVEPQRGGGGGFGGGGDCGGGHGGGGGEGGGQRGNRGNFPNGGNRGQNGNGNFNQNNGPTVTFQM